MCIALLPASEEGLESTIFCSEGLQLYLESEATNSKVFLVGRAILNPYERISPSPAINAIPKHTQDSV